jgi:phosphatidylglycerol:prolipoprotein diacylglycerol transferase
MYPRLFELPWSIGSFGPITVYTYGVLLAAAYLFGLKLAMVRAKKRGLDANRVLDLGIYIIISALVGAKLLLLITDFRAFTSNPRELLTLARSGGVFYGGLILAVTVALVYIRKVGLPLWTTTDVFAPGIALGQAIGRIGCFSAGCCWGIATHVPWAITFRNPQASELTGVPLGIPLHPTQLYECVADALIFAFLYFRIGKAHTAGAILGWYLALYSAARFVIEFFRFHEQGLHLGLSYTQWISLATLLAGVALLALRQGGFIHPRESVSVATSPRT